MGRGRKKACTHHIYVDALAGGVSFAKKKSWADWRWYQRKTPLLDGFVCFELGKKVEQKGEADRQIDKIACYLGTPDFELRYALSQKKSQRRLGQEAVVGGNRYQRDPRSLCCARER